MSQNGARPKSNRQHRTHPSTRSNPSENRISDLMEDAAEFEEFRATTLKAIRKDIRSGLSADDIRKKYAAIVQGRLMTLALTTENEATAVAVSKDILDRTHGKATEKKEVRHRFEDMSEHELDAMLKSEVEELEDMETRFEQ